MNFWSSVGILVTFGLALDNATIIFGVDSGAGVAHQAGGSGLQSRLLDRCCQVGREKAIESAKFNCKLSARDALVNINTDQTNFALNKNSANLLALSADLLLSRDQSFGDQCEMVLESCCMAFHRTKNCDSGKQFAKSGTSCMDVELSKEATVATESFNDCCMSCSLGILAAKNSPQNDTTRNGNDRCRLISHLASTLSGQMYEQTYTECCQENLPRPSSALHEPGAPIDCSQANSCSHRCLASGSLDPVTRRPVDQDRCDCFTGYNLGPDAVTCLDIDECKLNLHTCNRQTEICDNTRGSFRCLARSAQPLTQSHQQLFNFHHSNSHHSQHTHHRHQLQAGRALSDDRNDQSVNTELIERPFASLRLRPPSQARW